MSSAANELMWIKQLCTDFSITAKKPTLWRDHKSANLLAVNPISSDRSMHIRVRHLRVREYVEHDGCAVGLCSQLLMSWKHDVPRYCLDSKAGVNAKWDLSWACTSCVIENHGLSPPHIVKRSQIYWLPIECKNVEHPHSPCAKRKLEKHEGGSLLGTYNCL